MSSSIYSQSATASTTSSSNFAHCDTVTDGRRGDRITSASSTTTTATTTDCTSALVGNAPLGPGAHAPGKTRFDRVEPSTSNSRNPFPMPSASTSLPIWFRAPSSEQYVALGMDDEGYTVTQSADRLCSKPESTGVEQSNPPLLFAVTSVAQGSSYGTQDTKPAVVDSTPQLSQLLSTNSPALYPPGDLNAPCVPYIANLCEVEKKPVADGVSESLGTMIPELSLNARITASTPVPFGPSIQAAQPPPDSKHYLPKEQDESVKKGVTNVLNSLTNRVPLPGSRPLGTVTSPSYSPVKCPSNRVTRHNPATLASAKRGSMTKVGVRANSNQSGVCKSRLDRFDSTRPSRLAAADTSSSLSRSSYMCRKCRAHGKRLAVKGHKRNCPFRNCTCAVCSLVNYGRHIVAKQIALYRDQKNHQHHHHNNNHHHHNNSAHTHGHNLLNGSMRQFATQNDSVLTPDMKHSKPPDSLIRSVRPGKFTASETLEDEGPHCRRCRNHGKSNPWKGHKKTCPYRCCICQQCILISLRKSNEKNLREVVQEFMDERPEKRERHTNKSSGRHDNANKNQQPLSNGASFGAAPAIPINSNSYLPTLAGAVAFPTFGLNQPPSLFTYPYFSKLTEAYTASRLPIPNDLTTSTVTDPSDPMRLPLALPDALMAPDRVDNNQATESTISSSYSSVTLSNSLFKLNPMNYSSGDLLPFKNAHPSEQQTIPLVNGSGDGSGFYQPAYLGEYALDLVKGMTGAVAESTDSGTMATMTPTANTVCVTSQPRSSAFSHNSNLPSGSGKIDLPFGYTSDMGNPYYSSCFMHDYEGTSMPDAQDPSSHLFSTHPMMNVTNYCGSNKSFPIPDPSNNSPFAPTPRCNLDKSITWTGPNGLEESYGIPTQSFVSPAAQEAVLRNLVESAQQQQSSAPDLSSTSVLPLCCPMPTHFMADSAHLMHSTPNSADILSKTSLTVPSDFTGDHAVAASAHCESLQHTPPATRMPQGFSVEGSEWNLPTQWLPIPPSAVFRDSNDDYLFGATGYSSRAQQAAAFAAAAAAAVALHHGVSHSQDYRTEGAEYGSTSIDVPQLTETLTKSDATSLTTAPKLNDLPAASDPFQLSAQRLGAYPAASSFSSLQNNVFRQSLEAPSVTNKASVTFSSGDSFHPTGDFNPIQTHYSQSSYSMNPQLSKVDSKPKSGVELSQAYLFSTFLKDVPECTFTTWTGNSNITQGDTTNVWLTGSTCSSITESQNYSNEGPSRSVIQEPQFKQYTQSPNISFPVSLNSTLVSSTDSYLDNEVNHEDGHSLIVKPGEHSSDSGQTEESIDVVTSTGDVSVRSNLCSLGTTVNPTTSVQVNWNDGNATQFRPGMVLTEGTEQTDVNLLSANANSQLDVNPPWINTP